MILIYNKKKINKKKKNSSVKFKKLTTITTKSQIQLKNKKKNIRNKNKKNILKNKKDVIKIKKKKDFILKNKNLNNFADLEFFNVVCGNVFQNFLSVGVSSNKNCDTIMQRYLGNFEYKILTFFMKLESGTYCLKDIKNYLENNIFLRNIYFFFILLNSLNWDQFCEITKNLNKISVKNQNNSNFTLILLEFLKKLLNLQKLIKSFSNGLISEGHFKIAIKKYQITINIDKLLNNNEISTFFDNLNMDLQKITKMSLLKNNTIGFYDTIITRYTKYSLYSNTLFKPDLSFFLKKRLKFKLNQAKSRSKLSYAQRLALYYIGKPLQIPFAKKRINLRYRAYRIFLYAFKFKPFKLWQLTRRCRSNKYGGLLVDHLSKYELTIQNILLMSNFCITLNQVKEFLRKGIIRVNSRIITTSKHIIKPFDVIHFTEDQFRLQRNNFLLNLSSAFFKNIFNKEFSKLFEYNFKSFCCLMLPNFFKYRKLSLAPYYTIYNSGRFKIEKN